jgi:hypothetical protein
MRVSAAILSCALFMGLTAPAGAIVLIDYHSPFVVSQNLVRIAAPMQTFQMRSVSFLSAKLTERGFAIRDAKRQGQLYIFRASKNGTTALVSVDAINSKIVGLNVLEAPAAVQLRAAGSSGNHFIDESYEFGYGVSEADYETYQAFSQTEMTATDFSIDPAQLVAYEPLDEVSDGSDDLDYGEAGDAEGNALAEAAVEPLPGDAAIPDEPNADAIPPEPGADEPTEQDAPPEEPPPEDVPPQ